MLKLKQGCTVPFPEKLSEGYSYDEPWFHANVDADKIERVIAHFISLHNEPLFFILELPTNFKYETETAPGEVECLHKDIYYIDGCTQETALAILEKAAELLINDGMAEFGFGCHASKDEIMAGKYNVVDIYTHNKDLYDGFFETHGIERTEPLVTAWQTFSEEHYGECSRIDTDGKSVYDIPEMLKDRGIYFAERRER